LKTNLTFSFSFLPLYSIIEPDNLGSRPYEIVFRVPDVLGSRPYEIVFRGPDIPGSRPYEVYLPCAAIANQG
jgi:hypothetical protein